MENHKINRNGILLYVSYIVFAGLAIALGFIGFIQYNPHESSFWNVLYNVVRLFGMEHDFGVADSLPTALNIARFLAPAVLIIAVINIVWIFIRKKWRLFRLRCKKNHVVIFGLDEKAVIRAKMLKDVIIVIDKNDNAHVDDLTQIKHVELIIKDPADSDVLGNIGLLKAKDIYIQTGDDYLNLSLLKRIKELFSNDGRTVSMQGINEAWHSKRIVYVYIEITEHHNEYLFKQLEEKTKNNSAILNVHAFNIVRRFAASVIDRYSPDQYTSVHQLDNPPVHVLIYGLDHLGQYLTIEAAFMYHFGNLQNTHITIIDNDVHTRYNRLLGSFPNLEKVVQIELFEASSFWKTSTPGFVYNVSVCFVSCGNDAQNFIIGQRLRQLFMLNSSSGLNNTIREKLSNPAIVLLNASTTNLLQLFVKHPTTDTQAAHDATTNLNPGYLETLEYLHLESINLFEELMSRCNGSQGESIENFFFEDKNIPELASKIHSLYSNCNSMKGTTVDAIWDSLTDFEKDQNRFAARHVKMKLRLLGVEYGEIGTSGQKYDYALEKPSVKKIICEMEHRRWMAEKYLTGFVYGAHAREIDASLSPENATEENKLLKKHLKWHFDIIPYEELHEEEKSKDDAVTSVLGLLPLVKSDTAKKA